ncbi:MAG: LCP family glycopolymer transferase [Schwartzia sp. (in: firmicutes)]
MAKADWYERRKKAKKKNSYLWIWILLTLAFLAAVGTGMLLASSSLFDKPKRVTRVDRPNETLLVATDKTTVMIMGVDERDDDVGRSDTLMVATVDPKKKQVSLLSIPRDTRALLQGSYDKINSAYAYGGWKLTRDVVEDLLDTPIDHYVLINTRSFPRIIDAIGGIDLYVESRMYYVDEWDDAVPGGLVIDLYPGMQHMDGVTAMSYVRYRDEEGDIGRIERQQRFMRAVMEQVTSPAIVTKLPNVIRECMGAVETDLSFRQLLELAGSLKEAQGNGLRAAMLPGRPVYIDEVSYWIPDLMETRTHMASTLGITMSQKARSEMEREQREYEASIPSTAREVPPEDPSLGRPSGRREPLTLPRPSLPLPVPSAAGRTPAPQGIPQGNGTTPSRREEAGEREPSSPREETATEAGRAASEEHQEAAPPSIRPSWAETEGNGPRPGGDLARTPPGEAESAAPEAPAAPPAPARPAAPAAPSMGSSGKGQ